MVDPGKYTSHIDFIWVEVGMPHIGPEKEIRSDPEANRFDWFLAAFFFEVGG